MATATNAIVATIKPLHSLVQGVLGDTGEAYMLVTDSVSPHDFQLKPSQLKHMQQAHIIFYIDDSIESFLPSAFEVLPDNVRTISVAQKSGITLLPYRKDAAPDMHHDESHHDEDHHDESHHDEDHHDEGHHDEDHHDEDPHEHTGHHHHHHSSPYDMHVWLDPANASKIVALIADELSAAYPDQQAIYRTNAQNMTNKINNLDAELDTYLQPIRNKPFITFHDAYQYFEQAYGLSYAGSITIDPTLAPSPNRIRAIQQRLREAGAICIFKEPQFSDRLIATVSEGFDIKVGELDPLGVGVPAGEDAYFKLLDNLARNLRECLE